MPRRKAAPVRAAVLPEMLEPTKERKRVRFEWKDPKTGEPFSSDVSVSDSEEEQPQMRESLSMKRKRVLLAWADRTGAHLSSDIIASDSEEWEPPQKGTLRICH